MSLVDDHGEPNIVYANTYKNVLRLLILSTRNEAIGKSKFV